MASVLFVLHLCPFCLSLQTEHFPFDLRVAGVCIPLRKVKETRNTTSLVLGALPSFSAVASSLKY